MQRLSEFAEWFPVIAGGLGAAAAFLATAVGVQLPVSVALGAALFAATMSFRNWSVLETDRPLLADELTGLHDRVDVMMEDAADLRELLTDLAAIVEEAAAREQATMRSMSSRLGRLEEARAADPETLELSAMKQVREAIEPIADRLEHFDARTRKLALAIEKGLAAAEPTPDAAASPATARAARGRDASVSDASVSDASVSDASVSDASAADVESSARPQAAFDEEAEGLGKRYALMMQAVFSVPDGEPRFFEAFSRRLLGDGAVGPSADHVVEAKAQGGIGEIDNLTLVRCVAAAEQLRLGGRDVAVFCNLSMQSLRDPAYLRGLLGFLRRNAALSRHLVFEFSQTELDDFCDADIGVLQRLRETGFVFSIDHLDDWSIDIGNLAKVGFRYVKLDATALLAREEKNAGATARLARSFERAGLSMIVEKVETTEEARRLEAAGARFLQGQGLAEPRLIRVEDDDFINLENAARRAVTRGGGLRDSGDGGDAAPATAMASSGVGFVGERGARAGGVFERAIQTAASRLSGGAGWPQGGVTAHRRPD